MQFFYFILEIVVWFLKSFFLIGAFLFCSGVIKDFFLFYIIGPFFPRKEIWATTSSNEDKGRWVVITGPDSGIGRSYALELARRKFNICVINREPREGRPLDACLVRMGVSVKRIVFNFSELDEAKRAIQEKRLQEDLNPILPHVHILINNVGTMGKSDYSNVMCPFFKFMPPSTCVVTTGKEMIHVNQDSVLFLTQLIVPSMIQKRSGVLINVCSLCSYDGIWGSVIYCATKAFVFVFTEALRQELLDYNIVVQAVTPAFVNTKLLSPSLRALLPSFISVSPDAVAKGSLTVLGWQAVTHGCFLHAIQNRALLVMQTLCCTWIHDIIIRFFTQQLGEVARETDVKKYSRKLLD